MDRAKLTLANNRLNLLEKKLYDARLAVAKARGPLSESIKEKLLAASEVADKLALASDNCEDPILLVVNAFRAYARQVHDAERDSGNGGLFPPVIL